MFVLNRGYENSYVGCSDNDNSRTYIKHFHLSVIDREYNGKCALKIGASPTMCLNKISILNDEIEDDCDLSRTAGCAEDMRHVFEYEMKNNNDEMKDNTMLAPPKIH